MSAKTFTPLTLTMFTDPGHGWLELPLDLYRSLKWEASRYSYYSPSRRTVYLEEDCDAATAMIKLHALGYAITLAENHTDRNDIFIRKCFSIEDIHGGRAVFHGGRSS